MIDKDFNSIRSIINYDRASDSVLGNVTLNREELPNYFKLLETEELILTVDSQNDLQTNELVEGYIKRFGIKSMMDIPVRIEGKMVGLICFEELDRIRVWDVSEQKFALTIAQLIAQATETSRRQEAQSEFRKALEEKKLLLREINHRVRNNFNLINDMLNFQTKKAADDFHRKLFEDVRSRITSLNLVHRHLYQSENISEINFRDFLLDLVGNIRSMAMRESVSFITLLDSCKLPLSKAMLAGVIVNELLTNSILPVIDSHEELRVQLKLQVRGKMIIMSIEDNGSWHLQSSTGVGLQLVQALCEQLGSDLQQSHEKGTKFLITFSME
jgi:two-component sensor histidine kinase